MVPLTLSMLFENVASGSISAIEEAISAGIDVNAVHDGQSILEVAALSGDIAVIAHLLAAGARVDGPTLSTHEDGPRDTPLTAALQSNILDVPRKLAVSRALLERGADVTLSNGAGQSPLYIACDGAKWDPLGYGLIDCLVKAGSPVEPTLQALEARYQEEVCFDMMSEAEDASFVQLLERLRHIAGVSAPSLSPQDQLRDAIAGMDLAAMEAAVVDGADLNAPEAPALLTIVCNGEPFFEELSLPLIQWALSGGGEPCTTSLDGNVPLVEAASRGMVVIAEALIAGGAWADQANALGHTPLMAAAMNGHLQVCRLLLAQGADASLTGPLGSALTIAQNAHPHFRNEGVIELLQHAGSEPVDWVALRGVGSFDIDEQVALVHREPDKVASYLSLWFGEGYVVEPLGGHTEGIIRGPRSFVVYRFHGHDWTLIEALMPGIAPGFSDVPQSLSAEFSGDVLAYQNSPMFGESSLRIHRSGAVVQAMVSGEGAHQEGTWGEAVDAYLREVGAVAPGGSLRHLPGDRLTQLLSLGAGCVDAFVVARTVPVDPIGLDDCPL